MPFRTVFNGRTMVRREIKKVIKGAPKATVSVQESEHTHGGSGIPKPPTDADKKALKAKLQAELFRSL